MKNKTKNNQNFDKNLKTFITFVIVVIFVGSLTGALWIKYQKQQSQWQPPPMEPPEPYGPSAALHYYGKKVYQLSKKYNLPYEYLMALIVLETSGVPKPKPRFEPAIYKKLKLLQQGKISVFEQIKPQDIEKLSDDELKKLATSWGPFQIMGYKSFHLGISVDKLIKDPLKYGVIWIDKEYGWLLRQKRFKDAFHYHNTGKLYPSNGKPMTTDPQYVQKGLQYMEIFKTLKPNF